MKTVIACLGGLILAGTLHAAESYSCGPFLLDPGPDRMTVVIDHEKPVTATLTLSGADGGGKKVIEHGEPARHHLFVLEGLEPGAEYRYEVKTGRKHGSGRRSFRTLPEDPEQYRLIALGDVRSQPHIWHKVAQRIFEEEQEALFIIGTGDYPADGRQYGQWIDQFFVPARDLLARMPIWPSIGNHERTRASGDEREEESHYFSLFELPGNERWYRIDYQYLTLLVLDSNSQMGSDSEQYAWLQEQLRSERERFTMAAFHHAPFTSGPHGRRHEDGTPREWPVDQGQRFLAPLFEMYGVDLVLNGHDHLYERSYKDGVYWVVTGGGGAPLYKIDSAENPYQQTAKSVYHYSTLDVDKEAIRLTAVDLEGEIIDWVKIPVAEKTLERKRFFVREKVMKGVQVGAYSPETGGVSCAVVNVLELPLQVTVEVQGEKGGVLEEEPFLLGSGEERELALDLSPLLGGDARPTWQQREIALVKFALQGEGGDFGGVVEVEHEVSLSEPAYGVARMERVEIDGNLSEWGGVESMAMDGSWEVVLKPEGFAGGGDMKAVVRLGWSPGKLHLAVEVEDDAVVDDGVSAVWDSDSVELYFDGRPEEERGDRYGEWTSQNIIPVLRKAEGKFVGEQGWSADEVEWKTRASEGGYVLEMSIPFALITGKEQLRAGDRLRFDAMINDRDRGEKDGSHHRLWSRGDAWRDPSEFGILMLEE